MESRSELERWLACAGWAGGEEEDDDDEDDDVVSTVEELHVRSPLPDCRRPAGWRQSANRLYVSNCLHSAAGAARNCVHKQSREKPICQMGNYFKGTFIFCYALRKMCLGHETQLE